MTPTLLAFSHFIAALLCASLAIVIWNVGTRSPARMAIDLFRSLHSARSFLLGLARFLGGSLCLLLAGFAIATILPVTELDHFAVYFTVVIICALGVELLIGEDLRAAVRLKR
ncbi:MAG: hypothetical protein DLM50_07585 [Candidatus Meridianibacter frigidus]|nr:MAG: hypothetical protein DLM50_07585 [Candidatus Eremiobacteraeota bacterium]